MKLLERSKFREQSGFTLVEMIVVIALMGMVMALAAMFFKFSFVSEKKVEDEFLLQANMRQASAVLNNEIRNATVTFTLAKDVFDSGKKEKWNYFGVENGNEIVQYIWNESAGKHDIKVLLAAQDGITYNLYFTQNKPMTKLIQFNLECIRSGDISKKIAVETELNALNSIAVDDGGSDDNPAVAIAYRNDAPPTPEKVTIAVAMVLDDSGSMDFDMEGDAPTKRDSWGRDIVNPDFDSTNIRKNILKTQAKKLITDLASDTTSGGIRVSIIPFEDNADRAAAMVDCGLNKSSLLATIDTFSGSGGTNTGDGLRRAYYMLKNYKDNNLGASIVNYIILLTDGNPTYRSSTSSNYYSFSAQTGQGACAYVNGTGQEEEPNLADCMGYVNTIGQGLVVGGSLDIKTFVIGFSATPSDITRAQTIALSSCTLSGSSTRTGKYFYADGSQALSEVFSEISYTMKAEAWHIYGPY